MQEPAAVHATDTAPPGNESGEDEGSPPSIEELASSADVDGELRSLVDGIAMLGRFEEQLAEFESTLGGAVTGGA